MFKRVIKIILILLAIFLLVLGIIWLIGRHTAKEHGQTPLSFRQFLGLSTKQNTAQTVPEGTTSNFSNSTGSKNATGTTGAGTAGQYGFSGGISDNTQVSQFTNGGISLNGSSVTAGSNNGNSGNGSNTDNFNSIIDTTSGIDTSASIGGTDTTPACGTADTTITFTPEQIAQLNTLQNRFYALAQTLHTDADVATETANHDAFAVKAAQVTELYNYCEAKLPLITDPQLQQHVATPFWRQWNSNDVPANQGWDVNGNPQGTVAVQHDSLSFLTYNSGNYPFDGNTAAHITQIHDTGNSNNNPDQSGIKGPYGLLSFSKPTVVAVTGSVLMGNSSTTGLFGLPKPPDPLHLTSGTLPGETTDSNPADYPLLIPVVEKILRINLW